MARRILRDPEWFVAAVLGVDTYYDKQVELVESILRDRRTAVRGCVSSGKTRATAWGILAWLFAFQPSRAFTIAPSYRQVDTNLWAEIRKAHRESKLLLGGRLYAGSEYKIADDWFARGFSTKDPQLLHGIHGEHDLLVIDDAHGVPMAMYEEAENMMASPQTHMALLYNPAALNGPTYDCNHADRGSWHNIQIRYRDTPNGKAGKVVIPAMLTPEVEKKWLDKYGVNSAFYRVKALAEYPRQEADTLIPLDWIEQAMARELTADPAHTFIGVDVARFGDDSTVIATLKGRQLQPLKEFEGIDTMRTAGETVRELEQDASIAAVDVIGVGAGVVDRLNELEKRVIPVNVALEAEGVERDGKESKLVYPNLRSQLWWLAREALNPDSPSCIALPRDQDLAAELSSIKYKVDSQGRIVVEPKDAMKKRLGHSPDRADAVCLALYASRNSGPREYTANESSMEFMTSRTEHWQDAPFEDLPNLNPASSVQEGFL